MIYELVYAIPPLDPILSQLNLTPSPTLTRYLFISLYPTDIHLPSDVLFSVFRTKKFIINRKQEFYYYTPYFMDIKIILKFHMSMYPEGPP